MVVGVLGVVGIAAVGVILLPSLFSSKPMETVGAVLPHPDYEAERNPGLALDAISDSELEDQSTRPIERLVRVASGDTLADVLGRAGVDGGEAAQAINALLTIYNPRSLRVGQKVTVAFDRPSHGFGTGGFQKISLSADAVRDVSAVRNASGDFEGVESKRATTRQVGHYTGTIKSSLYVSAQEAGVPAPVILGMIKALSYDVDFQRDIQPGDTFEVLFEADYDAKGKLSQCGDMLYAAVKLSGKPIVMYRFENGAVQAEYFNEKGESIRKALLKTPVDGAKITSKFGIRNHPILGYTKMHKGVDFGVPTGTPIQAAGDGLVEMAGRNGGYGNYVRLRHGNGYGTAYAHMHRIAQGISVGKRVSQGQVIGFVGTTGRSTGPHLHYELLRGTTQVNPVSVIIPTNIKLAGNQMDQFKAAKRRADTLLTKIPAASRVVESALRLNTPSN